MAGQRRRRIVGTALGRTALVLASLVVGLAAAELFYRASQDDASGRGDADDDWYVRYRRMNETIYRRSEHATLVYAPAPGTSVPMEYGAAGFNEAGLREDREVTRSVGAATRVAVVGDSIVWGEFLPVGDAPAQQIGRALGRDFEVLNFGVSGYDTAQEAAYYALEVRAYDPAIVVVVFCLNDFLIMSGPFERFADAQDRAAKDAQEAWLSEVAPVRRETIEGVIAERERDATLKLLARAWGLWEQKRFSTRYVDEPLLAFADEPRRERTTAAITRLGQAIEADGARGLFVISPILESWDRYHWQAIHDHARSAAEEAGFEVLDLLEAWRGSHDPASMRIDTLHYDQSGSAQLGETVAEAVRALAR